MSNEKVTKIINQFRLDLSYIKRRALNTPIQYSDNIQSRRDWIEHVLKSYSKAKTIHKRLAKKCLYHSINPVSEKLEGFVVSNNDFEIIKNEVQVEFSKELAQLIRNGSVTKESLLTQIKAFENQSGLKAVQYA